MTMRTRTSARSKFASANAAAGMCAVALFAGAAFGQAGAGWGASPEGEAPALNRLAKQPVKTASRAEKHSPLAAKAAPPEPRFDPERLSANPQSASNASIGAGWTQPAPAALSKFPPSRDAFETRDTGRIDSKPPIPQAPGAGSVARTKPPVNDLTHPLGHSSKSGTALAGSTTASAPRRQAAFRAVPPPTERDRTPLNLLPSARTLVALGTPVVAEPLPPLLGISEDARRVVEAIASHPRVSGLQSRDLRRIGADFLTWYGSVRSHYIPTPLAWSWLYLKWTLDEASPEDGLFDLWPALLQAEAQAQRELRVNKEWEAVNSLRGSSLFQAKQHAVSRELRELRAPLAPTALASAPTSR